LRTAAREVAKTTSLAVVLINWWVDMAKESRRRVLETPEGHAAEDETSEVMAACLHLVREVPRDVDEWVEAGYAVLGREANRLLYQRAVQGYPSKASREKGEAILKAAVAELVQLIKELKEDRLPPNKVA
jgi:creatinine amidohydrolase